MTESSYFVVRCMMYGFGDDEVPYTESVDLLEDMLIAYITEMVSSNKSVFMNKRLDKIKLY